uniref:Uncharacterized protein n=1 Tax=Panstrongylus lignarius TaxID=156445 RepID=A0A224Y0M0_9HEMI
MPTKILLMVCNTNTFFPFYNLYCLSLSLLPSLSSFIVPCCQSVFTISLYTILNAPDCADIKMCCDKCSLWYM